MQDAYWGASEARHGHVPPPEPDPPEPLPPELPFVPEPEPPFEDEGSVPAPVQAAALTPQ